MKKILLTMLLCLAFIAASAQTRTHVVQRGETIESVARKYGVTVDELKKANPNAGSLFFTGMKLIIPTVQESVKTEVMTQTTTDQIESDMERNATINSSQIQTNENDMFNKGGTGSIASDIGFQYYFLANDYMDEFYDGFNCGLHACMGYRYYFVNYIFAEGLAGYRWIGLHSKKTDYSYNTHCITIPIHVGGLIPAAKKFGIAPFFGPHIDIPVASKVESGSKKQSVESHKTGVSLDFGMDFKFDGWALRAQYSLGLGGEKSVSKDMNTVSICVTAGI